MRSISYLFRKYLMISILLHLRCDSETPRTVEIRV